MGLSVGLNTAIQALRAHQLAVDVASHNIANVNSPGYSRQRVLLRPIAFDSYGRFADSLIGRTGNGVDASDVHRVRDIFLDFQARQTMGAQSEFTALAGALSRAELVFNEPGEDGMSAVFQKFWASWHDLANDPESIPARTSLVHAATTLSARTQLAHGDLTAQRGSLDERVAGVADRINAATTEIAELNRQIVYVEAIGDRANDLRDRRDQLIDDLSKLGRVSYTEQESGAVSLFFGNRELVVGVNALLVETAPIAANGGMRDIVFSDDGEPLDTSTGELAGLLQARDADQPALITKLNDLASGLITSVNALHSAGFGLDGSTGLAFFTGTDAASIGGNATLQGNPEMVAASAMAGAPGNAANALAIADLQAALTTAGGTQTFGDFYTSMVSVLGADANRAEGQRHSSELMGSHLETLRQSVAGVSLDEEVTNLNAAQHAYNAAGRVITTIDEMLDTLINRTGVFGR